MTIFIRLIIISTALFFFSFFYLYINDDKYYPGADFTISEMPNFKLKDLYSERLFNIKDLEGTYLINVWASWCITCRVEHNFLTKLDSKNIPIIGLNYKDEKKDIRNSLARNMYYAWYKPFFDYGVIHGDPHMGNYSVQDDLSINLYDFGCMRIFKSKFIQGVIDLYFALQKNDEALAVHAYEQWGFDDITKEKLDILSKWANFLYAPLMKDKVQKIQESDSGIYGAQIASEVHKELKKIGGVKPPKEFVFMDRAAVGLGSVFMHLRAEVNWYKVFHELIENFDQKKLTEKQQNTLKLVNL